MKTYFDEVSVSEDILIIPRNNNDEDAVVVISIKEYNSLTETAHLMSSEVNRKRLERSISQLKKGKMRSFSIEDENLVKALK